MILIVCPRCRAALRVTGDAEESSFLVGPSSDFWPDKFSCFRCEGKAQGFLEVEVDVKIPLDIIEVSPQEAFAAVHGLGVPSELEFNKTSLQDLLREKPVRKLGGRDIPGCNRFHIEFLELWDGTRLHLASSSYGAVVYKVTPPHSYADEVEP